MLRGLLMVVLVILIGRLYQLQLVDHESRRYDTSIEVSTTRFLSIAPRRGEILAADGRTLLAESVPVYNIGVLPGRLPPRGSAERALALARLAHIADIESRLVLDDPQQINRNPQLLEQLRRVSWLPDTTLRASRPITLTISPYNALAALRLSTVYSDALEYVNPIEATIQRRTGRHYETVLVKENVSQAIALVLRENSSYIPGAVVVEGYQRRYPQSAAVPSISHMLGYIGRITTCELEVENPAGNWVESLSDVVRYAPDCGLIRRHIAQSSVGILPYGRDDRIGKDGLEAGYESILRGQQGISSLLVDAMQRPVNDPQVLQPVQDGQNLILTIDLEFQRTVEMIVQRWIAESERRRQNAESYKQEYDPITNGVAVVMDPNNGRILAMVSLPTYDNNIWVDPERSSELQALLNPADPEARALITRLAPLTNRAIAGQYPPGSTLKQFVGAVALQAGVIAADTTLRDPGRLILIERSGSTYILPNASRADNGQIDIAEAMRLSSNVFFAAIAGGNNEVTNLGQNDTRTTGLGINRLAEGLKWFGFGAASGIRLAGETSGLVPSPTWKSLALREPWTTGNTYNTAIGQGYLEVTPLQLLNAHAAVVNGGNLFQPQLVDRIVDANGNLIEQVQPAMLDQVPIDAAHLAVMRDGMRRSVTDGLNLAARDECSGLQIAGKTGTAEFGPLIERPDGSPTRQSHSWFVGYAPYENPEIAVVVLLEGTGDLNDGSATLAVPAVTQIMQAYFAVAPPEDRPRSCPVMPQDPLPGEISADRP